MSSDFEFLSASDLKLALLHLYRVFLQTIVRFSFSDHILVVLYFKLNLEVILDLVGLDFDLGFDLDLDFDFVSFRLCKL